MESQTKPSGEEVAAMIQLYSSYSQSAEALGTRRVAFTQWSNSICFAIFAGIGLVGTWGIENSRFLGEASIVCLGLSLFGFLYSGFWGTQIRSYKDLGYARYAVLDQMAKRFSGVAPWFVDPYEMEWKMLEQRHHRLQPKKPRLTIEQVLPPLFQFVFLVVIPLSIGVIASRELYGFDPLSLLREVGN